MDNWLKDNLVCPRDLTDLHHRGDQLICDRGHVYRCVDGLPVMLIEEEAPTHAHCHLSLAATSGPSQTFSTNSVAAEMPANGVVVDPFVQQAVAETCGLFFVSSIGRLTDYPIPEIHLPPSKGGRLLDVGCNWGRWCVSAARLGYRPVGIDPAIEAVRAARRVAWQLGVDAQYIVADARHLPFRADSFDVVHTYSVLMHFAKEDATSSVREIARILKPDGTSLIQMANTFGLRNLQIQFKRGFSMELERSAFATRYWTPRELKLLFTEIIGPSHIEIEGFFSTSSGAQSIMELPLKYRMALMISSCLRKLGSVMPSLKYVADSLYVRSTRKSGGQ